MDNEKSHSLDVSTCVCVNVYQDGVKQTLDKVAAFKVQNAFGQILSMSREMPAFGVALHDETLEAMQSGLWLEFEFDGAIVHNGMFFEKLLFKLEKNVYGFNIVRYFQGKYDGRCFYFDLENPELIDDLYEFIDNIGNY
ncbi:MAG: hypothetical protein IJW24_03930 [Clostridia bacterium]|nr:hypothetical protein [Clostridia bacterium]